MTVEEFLRGILCWVWQQTFVLTVLGASVTTVAAPQQTVPVSETFLTMQWTTENGLPQNTVNAIAQTPEGYLWLATFGGLARFDGVRFQVFNSAHTPAFNSNRITALSVDRAGALWIGAENGDVVLYRQGEFTPFVRNSPRGHAVISIYCDRRNTLWVSDGRGLQRYAQSDPRNVSYLTQPFPLELTADNATYFTYQVTEDAQGRLWGIFLGALGYSDDGISFVKAEPGWPLHILELLPAAEGLWFYGSDGFEKPGFLGYKNFHEPGYQRAGGPVSYPRRSLARSSTGTVWAIGGFAQKGLLKLEAGQPTTYSLSALSVTHPIALFMDKEDNLWVGTAGDGLLKLSPRHLTAWTDPNVKGSYFNTIVTTADGTAWAGDERGLIRWRDGQFTRYTTRDGLPGGQVKALWPARDGTLWISTYQGLARWQDGQIVVPPEL